MANKQRFTIEDRIKIRKLIQEGFTLGSIGEMFSPPVSRQRIHQVKNEPLVSEHQKKAILKDDVEDNI